ncbi:MAG: ERCC4 domain-containing protein [Promethearchaeota archaeon]
MSYLIVTVDDREPPQLVDELAELGYEVEVKRLTKGDFERTTTIGEIKRGEDFFSSIVDNRIFNQAKRMHSTGKDRYLIMAGTLTDERWRLKPVIGAVLSLVFDYEVGIIPVPNMEATIAYAIHKIMERVDGKERRPIYYNRSRNYESGLTVNVTLEMLRSIPGIGATIGIEILKAYPTIVKLTEASQRELAAIPKVGKGRAKISTTHCEEKIDRGKWRMTHQDDDLKADGQSYQTINLHLRLIEFREKIQQEIQKLKITMDEALSPYAYVDWMKRGSGGIIWGHRFMAEVPLSYEALASDPEFKLGSVDVMLECLEEKYPFFQEENILIFDTRWGKRKNQAVFVTHTRINFVRELFSRLKEVSQTPYIIVECNLQPNGSLISKRDGINRGNPLHFTLSSQQWKIIQRMKWRGGMDSFPPEYYPQLGWFFQLVDQVKEVFIRSHNLRHRAGLTYEVEVHDNSLG